MAICGRADERRSGEVVGSVMSLLLSVSGVSGVVAWGVVTCEGLCVLSVTLELRWCLGLGGALLD